MKKSKKKNSRRKFIKENLLTGAGAILGINSVFAFSPGRRSKDLNTPAILGGDPVWDPTEKPRWSRWPIWNPQTDEPQVLEVLRSGVWSRAKMVTQFENEWAKIIGAKRCLTTVNGTNALICSLVNLNIGGGDEVIIPSYTFIATSQAVLQTGAMPVFVDTDPETFQIDVNRIEESHNQGSPDMGGMGGGY